MSFPAAVIMGATLVFGVMPATLLLCGAVILGVGGVVASFQFSNPWLTLAGPSLIAAAVLAVSGYVALYHAAIDDVDAQVARRLAGGVAANLFGVAFLIVTGMGERSSPGEWFVLVSPLVVGVAHLARFLVKNR
jgi:hypothetical protein